jgi:hypothetical protein
MKRARQCLAVLGLSAFVGGCAAADAEASDEEAADSTSVEALTNLSYQLSDEEATATTRRGSCEIKPGDLVFQRSGSDQAGAIAYLTKSELTHVGVVFKIGGAWNVYEAVGPVKITPLASWIARGQGGHHGGRSAAPLEGPR